MNKYELMKWLEIIIGFLIMIIVYLALPDKRVQINPEEINKDLEELDEYDGTD